MRSKKGRGGLQRVSNLAATAGVRPSFMLDVCRDEFGVLVAPLRALRTYGHSSTRYSGILGTR